MAIAQTGAIYKALTFAGTSSRTYGVYITGEAVYNAPEREVEMISIPGRNGAFALDKGRFENITVTYPAGIFADNETDFAAAVSDFRNFLCSKKGYCRLEDDYNTSEYRMAIYKSGLEVTPAMLRAGEFSITFDCKPQRWLTSGETATAVANNGTITNPTLFESSPLLEFKGYGDIGIGGGTISVENASLGGVFLQNTTSGRVDYSNVSPTFFQETIASYVLDLGMLNTGDDIQISKSALTFSDSDFSNWTTYVEGTATSQTGTGVSTTAIVRGKNTVDYVTTFDPITFKKGTSSSITHTYSMTFVTHSSGGPNTDTYPRTVQISYDGTNTISLSTTNPGYVGIFENASTVYTLGNIYGASSLTPSGTKYIDLDIGEAYTTVNGSLVSLDYAVSLGAKLPTLAPGINTITYDNTITNFKVTPRWWKV